MLLWVNKENGIEIIRWKYYFKSGGNVLIVYIVFINCYIFYVFMVLLNLVIRELGKLIFVLLLGNYFL